MDRKPKKALKIAELEHELGIKATCFFRIRKNTFKKNINQKIDILNLYKSQFNVKHHYFTEDFIRGLAHIKGAQVESMYSEAFEVIRWIQP